MKKIYGFFILIIISLLIVFIYLNLQKRRRELEVPGYQNVDLVTLLSFGNFYNGKQVCTGGFYFQTDRLSIIKVSLKENEYTRSAWVSLPAGKEIITKISGKNRYVVASICGYFESHRTGEFGSPAVWNHQLTVEEFKTLGDQKDFDGSF